MRKISKIEVIKGSGRTSVYELGQVFVIVGVRQYTISRIEDLGKEFENSIFSLYHVYDENDEIVNVIENCPVVVDYVIE